MEQMTLAFSIMFRRLKKLVSSTHSLSKTYLDICYLLFCSEFHSALWEGGRKLPFPITLASGLYIILYYRTSRDVRAHCFSLIYFFIVFFYFNNHIVWHLYAVPYIYTLICYVICCMVYICSEIHGVSIV